MTTALTNYIPTDMAELNTTCDAWEKAVEENKPGASKIKLIEGTNVLRILPARKDAGSRIPFLVTWIHWVKNPYDKDAKGRPVICPLKTEGKPCAVCAVRSKLLRTGITIDKEAAYQLIAKQSIYCNAINMMEPDKGVQVWDINQTIFGAIRAIMAPKPAAPGMPIDSIVDPIDLSDPGPTGRNLLVTRTGSGKLDTRYSNIIIAPRPSALSDMKLLDQLHDLKAQIKPMTVEAIMTKIEGREEEMPADMPTADDLMGDDLSSAYTPPKAAR